MASVKVYKQTGESAGVLELEDKIFAVDYNEPLIHQAVVAQLNNARQGTKSTLTRTEVRGGGIKPWRQKGTGRARQGSIRAPQWIKGGVVFAPKPRDFSQKVNKVAKRGAFLSALSEKVRNEELVVVDEFKLNAPKTKEVAAIMNALKLNIKTHQALNDLGEVVTKPSKALPKIILLVCEGEDALVTAAANIPYIKTMKSNQLSVYDVVASDKLLASKAAVKKIEEAYKA